MTSTNGKSIKSEIISETRYYQNEDEFCNNFKNNMKNPLAIEEMKESVKIKMNKLSLKKMNYEIYSEVATFEE